MRLGHLLPFLLLVRFAGAQSAPPTPAIVAGTVVDAVTGDPIAGARVKLDFGQNSSDEPLFAKTGPGGRFEFSVPPHASYTIVAQARGYLTARRASWEGGTGSPQTVPLTAYAVISGQVIDPYGVPLPDAMVEVWQKQATGSIRAEPSSLVRTVPGGQFELVHKAQIRADDQGRFRAGRLEPGTYYVTAIRPPGFGVPSTWEATYRPTYYPGAADPLSAKPLELAAGAKVRADIRILRQTGAGVRVAGRLAEPPSTEEVYTRVTIVPQPGLALNTDRADATVKDDEFEIVNVLPGKYTLLALTQTRGDNPYNSRPLFGALENIEVKDGDLTGIEVRSSPLADLAGTVTFAEGCKPVPLRIASRPSPLISIPPGEVIPAADGTFVLNRLIPGRYTLYIESLASFQRPETSVRIGDREIPKEGFEVPLAGPATLRVTVSCEGAGRAQ